MSLTLFVLVIGQEKHQECKMKRSRGRLRSS